ncbi:hypothetical protein EW146_g1426 [Bondarzewia mesenterica]|uniref:Reverse transcriptase domain-containing protein n=1 Tax=Bondarzewia mesenterica TaxID=1095465 RepID=A0A4S4M3T2_9AGAM|nr:hypothetical protein EW146_g1426 [Bondarzewia mesenterica]
MGDATGKTASLSISAPSAGLPHTLTLIVHEAPHASKTPRFLWGFLWSGGQEPVTPSASATETAAPLPSIPDHFLRDETSQRTIRDNPDLFKIVMTVNVDRFEYMLRDHPNSAFMQSIVRGLRIGFWPCAEGPGEGYPESWDESRDSFTPEGLAFIKEQCKQEERLGRFSAPFKDLLPGMYSMPIHAVPKPHTDSFCMVVDHSAGNYSLNSLIDRDAVSMRLDNVQDLACNLLSSRSEVGNAPIWLFKSDVSQAYRRLPMHLLWQIKQIVTVDVRSFVHNAPKWRRKLVEWLRVLGYANWSLNVAPLLRPALQSAWEKTRGKKLTHAGVAINKEVTRDLLWFAKMFERSDGIIILQARIWSPEDADLVLYTDTSLSGLGFWCLLRWEGFMSPLPSPPQGMETIFWYEALTVLSALIYATTLDPPPTTLAIFTDNLNTVQIFKFMSAYGAYNFILLSAIEQLISHHIDLRVLHVAGDVNIVADSLSRGLMMTALRYAPGLRISPFIPPRDSLGATWCLVRERAIALGSDLDKSTRASYNSHLQSYLTFCKMHAFPIAPSEDTLSFYVVYMCHHIQPDSVATYLLGICNCLQPFFPHIWQMRAAPLVSRTLAGCVKLYKTPTNQKKPLSIEDLSYATSLCTNQLHDDKLFFALLHCSFFALHKLGELVVPDRIALRDWRKVIKCSSVMAYTSGFGYHLPYHKGDHFFDGNMVIILSQDEADPLPIFNAYLSSRDSLFCLHPALWLTSAGTPPTRAWFLRRLHTIFPTNITGHSLRAGGATHFAAAGWPDECIQALGRWTSQAFKTYIRKNPVILQALVHGRTIAERDATQLPQ